MYSLNDYVDYFMHTFPNTVVISTNSLKLSPITSAYSGNVVVKVVTAYNVITHYTSEKLFIKYLTANLFIFIQLCSRYSFNKFLSEISLCFLNKENYIFLYVVGNIN